MIFLEGGRVVDPATRVDGIRTVILDGGRIKEVREQAPSPVAVLDIPKISASPTPKTRASWILGCAASRSSISRG